eukprot:CAMPEP_0119433220 /NCGR_PEP_ID=MMETSP1335-20130426/49248_1 /TAXON_ID=259385 /ORGANISM="Chrysoculter rhomboideus, Strain RCC1486" /LENGTH=272 /DNA_ID=CAMNT_0007459055 /DNA_START=12 /DNA_END=827 /DNA_ORIENTATION=+
MGCGIDIGYAVHDAANDIDAVAAQLLTSSHAAHSLRDSCLSVIPQPHAARQRRRTRQHQTRTPPLRARRGRQARHEARMSGDAAEQARQHVRAPRLLHRHAAELGLRAELGAHPEEEGHALARAPLEKIVRARRPRAFRPWACPVPHEHHERVLVRTCPRRGGQAVRELEGCWGLCVPARMHVGAREHELADEAERQPLRVVQRCRVPARAPQEGGRGRRRCHVRCVRAVGEGARCTMCREEPHERQRAPLAMRGHLVARAELRAHQPLERA